MLLSVLSSAPVTLDTFNVVAVISPATLASPSTLSSPATFASTATVASPATLKFPDKSKLPQEYFIFYSKAFDKLNQIWNFKSANTKIKTTTYDNDYGFDKSNNLSLNKIPKENFNSWFNEEFEKAKTITDNKFEKKGYNDWLKSNEDLTENCGNVHSLADLHSEIERKKNDLRSVVLFNGIQELPSSNFCGTSLIMNEPDNYDADLFSGLAFQDLKKAHTETVIPVSQEDFNSVKQFKNSNEFNAYRTAQEINYKLLTVNVEEKQQNNKEEIKRYYELMKQTEKMEEYNKKFWSKLHSIKN